MKKRLIKLREFLETPKNFPTDPKTFYLENEYLSLGINYKEYRMYEFYDRDLRLKVLLIYIDLIILITE